MIGGNKVNKKKHNVFYYVNKTLLFAFLALLIFGLFYILTASSREAVVRYDKSLYYYFNKHLMWIILSSVAGFIILIIPSKKYKYIMPFIYIGVFLLLVYLYVYGIATRGSTNWIPVFGLFKVQPGELAKPVLIFTLAILFEMFYKKLRDPNIKHYTYIAIIIIAGVIFPLIVLFLGDLGTALIIGVIFVLMFLASPIKRKEKFYCTIGGIVVGAIMILVYYLGKGSLLSEEQISRLTSYHSPCSSEHYQSSGYQICNGYIAINNGGLFGLGIGNSKQKYSYIPDPHTDSVFAIIAEELGVTFSTIILLAYIIILYNIAKISSAASSIKGKYISLGVLIYMIMHILLNLGGLFGVIPLTGVPLPLLSYGGSFMLSFVCSIALVLRVDIETKIKNEKLKGN